MSELTKVSCSALIWKSATVYEYLIQNTLN